MLGPGKPAPAGRHHQRPPVGHWTCFRRCGGRRLRGRRLPGKQLGHTASAVKNAAPLPSRRRPDQAQGRWTKVWVRTCRLWQHDHRRTRRRTRPRARHCVQHANHQGYLSNCKVTASSGPWTRLLPPTLRAEKPPEGGLRTQDPGMSPLAGSSTLGGEGAALFYTVQDML